MESDLLPTSYVCCDPATAIQLPNKTLAVRLYRFPQVPPEPFPPYAVTNIGALVLFVRETLPQNVPMLPNAPDDCPPPFHTPDWQSGHLQQVMTAQ